MVPESSPPPEEEDEDEDADGEEEDEGYQTRTQKDVTLGNDTFMSSIGNEESPRGFKRSRDGTVKEQDDRRIADTARDMARNAGHAPLNEELDDVVLQTENLLTHLDVNIGSKLRSPPYGNKDDVFTSAAAQLTNIWAQHSKLKTIPGGIGPESEDALTTATYISSLLFQLHTPFPMDRPPSAPMKAVARKDHVPNGTPLPQSLLHWLNAFHTPLRDDFDEIHLNRPSPSAHDAFWDFLGAELLRGKFARVARLLRDAGWEYAATAQDDKCAGRQGGYHGKNLQNVENVVDRFIKVLENRPAGRDGNWDVRGPDWQVFRQRIRRAVKDLESFAVGSSADEDDTLKDLAKSDNIFAKTNSGLGSMAAASQRATSRVPHTIYETLKTLYGVMLGGDEIVDYAQDWLEATILFTVWWDGDERSEGLNASLAGRNSLRKSKGPGFREVDVTPLVAYRKRLAETFRNVTSQIEENNFQPDTLDPVQVGLICVIEDEVQASVELLRIYDPTVATAVVEFAALGGWLPLARPTSRGGLLQRGFSTEDLMVLSHGPPPSDSVDRDEVLTEYADLLAGRDVLTSDNGKVEKEGWELAVSVLGRLDDRQAAQGRITGIFDSMEFRDEARVDKVLKLCTGLGLDEQAKGIAEVGQFVVSLC